MSLFVRTLVTASGLSEQTVKSIALTAPTRYKVYPIEKRSGGERIIAQPAREVKFLQRIFVDEFLSRQPIHHAAMAYRPGISIKENASAHSKNNVILKFDFKDFFPSLVESDWVLFCKKNSIFSDDEDIRLSSHLLFWRKTYGSVLRMAIGAPSSPILSNILMREFDEKISETVMRDKITYTRYADDLTFSAKRTGFLVDVEKNLRKLINDTSSPKLKINEEKTVLSTKKFRRVVTGLVLADDRTVSLGRYRKRIISATVHKFKLGNMNKDDIQKLSGMLSFAYSIEPDFISRLKAKYGSETIDNLKKTHRYRDTI